MTVEDLLQGSIPAEIEERIDTEDREKLVMCAHDVMRDNPHSQIQLI